MSVYKFTFPCKLKDVNGNIVDAEKFVVFDNKEELLEYISGDMDGNNYGSGLLRIRKHDEDFYTKVGKMCNRIAYLLWRENVSKGMHTIASVCHQIENYMMFPSVENAKKLYPILRKTRLEFLDCCYFALMDMDVDGDRPWEQEWCDKFVGMIRSNLYIYTKVLVAAANYIE